MSEVVPISLRIKAIDKFKAVFDKATKGLKGMKKATMQASNAFTNFRNKTKKMRDSIDNVGKGFKSVGKNLSTKLSLPIVGVGTAIIATAANFEKSMNKVKAKVEVTSVPISALEKEAQRLGSSTMFSASQAADSFAFLAQAGFKSHEILAAGAPLLDLAAASGMDLAQTADIASNVMGAFGLKADQAGRVADVFAAATAGANIDMEMLGQTMKEAAPIGFAFGASLEDTTAAVGLLGNIGIQGSKAGTALKNSFLNLASPTGKAAKVLKGLGVEVADSDGKMLRFQDIMANLGGKLKDLPQEARLQALNAVFGKIGIAAASNLQKVAESGELGKFSESLLDVKGRASEMAGILQEGAAGSVTTLKSAMEGLAITIAGKGKNSPLGAFTEVTKSFAEFIQTLSQNNPQFFKTGLAIAGIAFLLGPLITAVGSIITIIPALITLFGAIKIAILAIKLPLLLIMGKFLLFGLAAFFIIKHWDKIKEFFAGLWKWIMEKFTQGVTFVGEKVDEMLGFIPDFIKTKVGITPEIADENLKKNRRGLRDTNPLPDNVRSIRGRSARIFDKAKENKEALEAPKVFEKEAEKLGDEKSISDNIVKFFGDAKEIVKPENNVKNENKVQIDFQNVPRGTSIKTESSDSSMMDVNTGQLAL